MIRVLTNRRIFEYDIHSLIKAFYPGEEISFFYCEDDDLSRFDPEQIGAGQYLVFTVRYTDSACLTACCENGRLCGEEASSYDKDMISPDSGRAGTDLKNIVKRTLYRLLSFVTGKELPWGTLTGIRPTRLVMRLLSRGESDDGIRQELKREYYISDEKLGLSLEIAKRERSIIDASQGARGYSLYIGIPFCPTTCLYCSFTSFPIAKWRKRVGDYITALKKELRAASEMLEGRRPDTVYIGGGTPTSLEPEELSEILLYIGECFDLSALAELTVEAGRPDSITAEKLAVLKEKGVSRISINPQTMNDGTLKAIGRRHTAGCFRDAFFMAREAGFDNINTDLILGLPGEGENEVKRTFSEIEKLGPDSVTVHCLAVKRAAALSEYVKGLGTGWSVITPETMRHSEEVLRGMGLKPYYLYRQKNMSGNFENTGYALEGKYGIYNILMMEEVQDIVALGAGTVTKRVCYDEGTGKATGLIERCDNVKDVEQYIDRIDEMTDRKRKLFGFL